MVLKKRNKVIHTFEAGQDILFKLKNEKYYQKAMIVGFSDHIIHTHYYDLHFDEIDKIKLSDSGNHFVNLASGLTLRAGLLFLAVDQINQGLVRGQGFGPSEETLLISGSLVGVGLLLKLFVKNKFKITGHKYRLEATDFNY